MKLTTAALLAIAALSIATHDADAQLSFTTGQTLAAGLEPKGVAFADFDNDGDQDLAIANSDSPFLSMYRNDSGTMTFWASVAITGDANAIAAADFDGDGDIDLAAANGNNDNATILLNGGGFFFGISQTVSVGQKPSHVTAADMDGDGDADLALTNRDTDNVTILTNASGTFSVTQTIAVGTDPRWVTAGDFDGDGDRDLAVVNHDSNSVSILTNGGGASFSTSATLSLLRPNAVETGDLDGDGDMDLAVTQGNQTPPMNDVVIYRNNGSGTFQVSGVFLTGVDPHGLVLFDADSDGDLDIATADTESHATSLLENNGAGAYLSAISVPVGVRPQGVGAADIDGDGDMDLAVANRDSNNVTLLDNGTTQNFVAFGDGCVGTSGMAPTLSGSGSAVANGSVTLEISGGPSGAGALLLIGTLQASVPVGPSCDLLVSGLLGGGVPLGLGVDGSIALTGSLPASVIPATIYFQSAVADSGASNGIFTLTNGLAMNIH